MPGRLWVMDFEVEASSLEAALAKAAEVVTLQRPEGGWACRLTDIRLEGSGPSFQILYAFEVRADPRVPWPAESKQRSCAEAKQGTSDGRTACASGAQVGGSG